jgi:hypothetical protein
MSQIDSEVSKAKQVNSEIFKEIHPEEYAK